MRHSKRNHARRFLLLPFLVKQATREPIRTSLTQAISAVVFVGLLSQRPAICSDIVVENIHRGTGLVTISLSGEVKQGDDLIFARLTRNARHILLFLDSSGGDPDTAMTIGSLVRKHEGHVVAEACYSACVLIFAGGVMRTGGFSTNGPVVGVHRIFFAELQPGLTTSHIKAQYDAQLNRIKSYLAEMNVAPEFLSFMQSFAPSNMHVMTQDELNRYGIGWEDVIYNERETAEIAELRGISSMEYRSRMQRARDECGSGFAVGKTKDEIRSQQECADPIEYGTSVEIYRQRKSEVRERCRQYTDATQNNRCFVHYMTTGRATP